MIFTREQIEEIRRRLKVFGSKDTEFPLAHVPLTGEEFLAIVQDGINKRATIAALYFGFNQYLEALRKEIYDYIDAIIAINNLKTPDANIISISDDGTLNNYTVSKSSRLIEKGDTNIVITLQPNTGYYFNPTSIEDVVTVSMVDDDLEGNIDIQGGKDNIITISISKVTGNITIEAETQAYEYHIFLYNPNNSGIWKCGDEPITTESVKHKYNDEEKVYTFYKNSDVEFIDNDKFEFNTEGNFEPPTGITVEGTSIRVYHITDSVGITPRVVALSNAIIEDNTNGFTVTLRDSNEDEVSKEDNKFNVTIGETYTIELQIDDSTKYYVPESSLPRCNGTPIPWVGEDGVYKKEITITDSTNISITGDVAELPKLKKASSFEGFKVKEKIGNGYIDYDFNDHIQYDSTIIIKLELESGYYVDTPPTYTIAGQSPVGITVGQDITISNIQSDITLNGKAFDENGIYWGIYPGTDYTEEDGNAIETYVGSNYETMLRGATEAVNAASGYTSAAQTFKSIFVAYPSTYSFPEIKFNQFGQDSNAFDDDGDGKLVTITDWHSKSYKVWVFYNTFDATYANTIIKIKTN